MTSHDAANLDDVMVPTEEVHPDHREHAKEAKHLSEDELERRTRHERDIVEAERPSDHG
ncbi:hypothetical protein [Mycolicibacterium hodleri]|uniref:hypothetical protein n=1 Tax=Mycolicibacterium hodleri TaxID=49897 RepID=UPI00163BE4D0|nr:hypothetical protein [Mycolicibacterium hodleri]